jgi:hypothetical protein
VAEPVPRIVDGREQELLPAVAVDVGENATGDAGNPWLIFYTMMEEVIHFHGVAVLKTA